MIQTLIDALQQSLDELKAFDWHTDMRNSRRIHPQIAQVLPPGDLLGAMVHLMVLEQVCDVDTMVRALRRDFPRITVEDILAQLDWHRVGPRELQYEVKGIMKAVQVLTDLAMAPSRAAFHDQLDFLERRLRGKILVYPGVLLKLRADLDSQVDRSLLDGLEAWATMASPRDCRTFFRSVVRHLEERLPVRETPRVEAPVSLPGTMRTPEPASPVASVPPGPDILPGKDEAAWYRQMNQSSHDFLLDRLHEASQIRDQYRKGNVSAKDFADFCSPVLANLLKFLRSRGLNAQLVPGTELELDSPEAAVSFDYRGSEFSPGERKKVVVESPGWKLGEDLVSRATVREVPVAVSK